MSEKTQEIKYDTERMAACGRCINALNDYREVAQDSYKEAGEMLLRGMKRNRENDCLPDQSKWKREKALNSLLNLEAERDLKLPDWLNRQLAKPSSRARVFKTIRGINCDFDRLLELSNNHKTLRQMLIRHQCIRRSWFRPLP